MDNKVVDLRARGQDQFIEAVKAAHELNREALNKFGLAIKLHRAYDTALRFEHGVKETSELNTCIPTFGVIPSSTPTLRVVSLFQTLRVQKNTPLKPVVELERVTLPVWMALLKGTRPTAEGECLYKDLGAIIDTYQELVERYDPVPKALLLFPCGLLNVLHHNGWRVSRLDDKETEAGHRIYIGLTFGFRTLAITIDPEAIIKDWQDYRRRYDAVKAE